MTETLQYLSWKVTIWPMFVCHPAWLLRYLWFKSPSAPQAMKHQDWEEATQSQQCFAFFESLHFIKVIHGSLKTNGNKGGFHFFDVEASHFNLSKQHIKGHLHARFHAAFLRFYCLKSTQVWNETRAKCIFMGQNKLMQNKNAIQKRTIKSDV